MPELRTTVVPLAAAAELGRGDCGFYFPADLLGQRRRLRIAGTINGRPFATGANPVGDGRYFVFINTAMRRDLGLTLGDAIQVVFEIEASQPALPVPDDLAAALESAGVAEVFAAMAWSHRKEYLEAIAEAKRPATRERRIAGCVASMRERGGR